MTASTARSTALSVVSRVRERGSFAHETLNAALNRSALSEQNAALATRIAYGTIACRGTLDEAVARFVRNRSALEPRVADALAIAAYELLFMRTPAWAAVNEGVDLVRSTQPRAAGLANAVLRRLADDRDAFPWGDPATDDAALARLTGHPEWLVSRLIDDLGREQATKVLAANNEPAPLYLAYLPFRGSFDEAVSSLDAEGAEPQSCDLPACIRAANPAKAVSSRALATGSVIVCDAGAQFAAHAMNPTASSAILDIGAGRGTKTLIMQGLAMTTGGPATITAVDTHQFKLDALAAEAERLGVPRIRPVHANATRPLDELLESTPYDVALVDAPCSGLGTLRRHPDKRWRLNPDDIGPLAELSAALLAQAARLVGPEGFVVYSTCTLTRAENDDVIAAFLGSPEGTDFVLDSLADDVPATWKRFVRGDGTFLSLPEVDGFDGHFVARMRRH